MKQYVILIQNRSDMSDRYWIIRNSIDDAMCVAKEYTKDSKYYAYVHELGKSI